MTQELINGLKNLEGKARGVTMQTDASYVSKKMGQDALVKLQQKTKEMGWEVDYANIKTMDWYPIGMRVLSLLAAKEAFGLGDKEIEEMGNFAPKYSFIASTMLRYFLSIEQVFKEASKYWEKHYSIGELEAYEIDIEKKYAILRLKNFEVHPVICTYFCGYFLRISQLVMKSEKITAEETKCIFKQGPYHEFLVKWI